MTAQAKNTNIPVRKNFPMPIDARCHVVRFLSTGRVIVIVSERRIESVRKRQIVSVRIRQRVSVQKEYRILSV